MSIRSFLATFVAGASRHPAERPSGARAAEDRRQRRQPGEVAGHPRPFGWLFDPTLRVAVISAIVGAAIPIVYSTVHVALYSPPNSGILTGLMAEEAAAAAAHNTNAVGRIYAADAVVTDAGCQTPGGSQSWIGRAQIKTRYRVLPRFSSLHHVNPLVIWQPDNSGATEANVTAETVGVIKPSGSSPNPQFIGGNELWTFALLHGRWVITSFTYNLCLPMSKGG